MADRKISDLTALTTPASGDYLPIVDISEAAAASKNKRITIEELFRGVPLGTAAAPSIAIEGDENTGIYSPGADQLAISTGGSGRLFVDSSGNVAIVQPPQNAPNHTRTFSVQGQNASIQIRGNGSGTFTNQGLFFVIDGNEFSHIYQDSASGLVFRTGIGLTERLRITWDGKLGLGTSAPGAPLHVKSTATAGGNIAYFDDSGSGVAARFQISTTGGTGGSGIRLAAINRQTLELGGALASVLAVDIANSRVGIGTTSPAELLDVNGTLGAVRVGTSGNILDFTRNALNYIRATGAQGELHYQAWIHAFLGVGGATEYGRFDTAGRLLVGTSTTSATGTIFAQGSSSSTTGPSYLYLQRGQAAGASIGNGTSIGIINFADNASGVFAQISAEGDAPSSSGDYPGRLVFSTTSDSASSPTERLRITSAGVLQIAEAGNIAVGTTTGTKIGTATTQKLGFYNATPVVQPAAVADATDAATVITQLNDLLAKLRTLGLIAT
jgi:hypothetical protein